MVSHDMELVADFAQRVIVLGEGSMLADDSCQKVMVNAEALRSASLAPPQIAELADRLGDDFKGILTLQEMTEKIESRCSS
jgi:energy-coupling factor transport system ATP-binding protein